MLGLLIGSTRWWLAPARATGGGAPALCRTAAAAGSVHGRDWGGGSGAGGEAWVAGEDKAGARFPGRIHGITDAGKKGNMEVRERRKKGGAVRRPRQELAGAWRRRTGAGEGRIQCDGAESLNIQTRRISFFILLVLFVQRKEKRKAATPPAGWMTATRARVVQPLRRVRMRTYHQTSLGCTATIFADNPSTHTRPFAGTLSDLRYILLFYHFYFFSPDACMLLRTEQHVVQLAAARTNLT
ncbi:uncharacterized protein [Triticum aestivum]|uniref:uncharacterized protein n=1 Tax=Triticum aestivum TaxID=4565 RepID=UPI001D00B3AB|nr:uncharacterized protein LOC123158691 [Triticum aestivum]